MFNYINTYTHILYDKYGCNRLTKIVLTNADIYYVYFTLLFKYYYSVINTVNHI